MDLSFSLFENMCKNNYIFYLITPFHIFKMELDSNEICNNSLTKDIDEIIANENKYIYINGCGFYI